ncbi:unnamed protein product, partial [marine sediment metagenome]
QKAARANLKELGVDMMYVRPESNFVKQNEHRWNRVLHLLNATDSIPNPVIDDRWTVRAWNFMKQMKAAIGEARTQASIANNFPALYEAFTLRMMGNDALISVINAMLAQQTSYKTLSQEYGTPAAVFEWYVKLFRADFDPDGDKPTTRSYMVTVQNPVSLSSSFSARNQAGFLMMFSISFQPDTLWDIVERRELGEEEHERLMSAYISMAAYKALEAVVTLQPNSFNAVSVMDHFVSAYKTRRELDLAQQLQGGAISELVNYVIKGAKWAVMEANADVSDFHQPNQRARKIVKSVDRSPEDG